MFQVLSVEEAGWSSLPNTPVRHRRRGVPSAAPAKVITCFFSPFPLPGALAAAVNYFIIIMITPVRPHSHLPKENIIPIAAFSILLF